jgi:hypothetical protein
MLLGTVVPSAEDMETMNMALRITPLYGPGMSESASAAAAQFAIKHAAPSSFSAVTSGRPAITARDKSQHPVSVQRTDPVVMSNDVLSGFSTGSFFGEGPLPPPAGTAGDGPADQRKVQAHHYAQREILEMDQKMKESWEGKSRSQASWLKDYVQQSRRSVFTSAPSLSPPPAHSILQSTIPSGAPRNNHEEVSPVDMDLDSERNETPLAGPSQPAEEIEESVKSGKRKAIGDKGNAKRNKTS